MDAVRRHFRPEFINRIDEIVVFHRLRREADGVRSSISRCKRLQKPRRRPQDDDRSSTTRRARGSRTRATIRSTGARPLKRVIQKHVQDPLAEEMLRGRDQGRRYGAGVGARTVQLTRQRRGCEGCSGG